MEQAQSRRASFLFTIHIMYSCQLSITTHCYCFCQSVLLLSDSFSPFFSHLILSYKTKNSVDHEALFTADSGSTIICPPLDLFCDPKITCLLLARCLQKSYNMTEFLSTLFSALALSCMECAYPDVYVVLCVCLPLVCMLYYPRVYAYHQCVCCMTIHLCAAKCIPSFSVL